MRRDDAMRRPSFRRALAWKAQPTVEAIEKRLLMAAFFVKNTLDDPLATDPGSLRSVILASNATAGPNTITFTIAATGVQTINLTKPLPAVTTPATIDATAQLIGATPGVYINGAGITGGGDGLDLTAGTSAVKGLGVIGFSGEGISLTGVGGDTVSNNFIGVGSTGAAAGNGFDGIVIGAGSNNDSITNNLISGNKAYGIKLDGTYAGSTTTTASGTTITGNEIGLNTAGNGAISNLFGGLQVRNAPSSIIGGGSASARNVISGNNFTVVNGITFGTGDGIDVLGGSTGTIISGNYVGISTAGSAAVRNTGAGISITGATGLTIGGNSTSGATNVISGNSGAGITGSVAGAVTIQGNNIGTNAFGTGALGNGGDGITITGNANTLIGGASTSLGNTISANAGNGITTNGFNESIQGNTIGLGSGGIVALGNTGAGIVANGSGDQIGSTVGTSAANTIANNNTGVVANGFNVSILYNSIYNNATVGIQASTFFAPAPVLSTAVSNVNVSAINGTLTATNGSYLLQFFVSPTLNASNNAEGRAYLSSYQVTVTNGTVLFNAPSVGFQPGEYITATATLITNNLPQATSPFSTGVVGTGSGPNNLPPVFTVAAAPSTVAAGENVQYVYTIANTSTVADQGVAFIDPIPAGTAFFSGLSSSGSAVVVTNGVANSTIGTIAANSSVTVTITLTTLAGAVPSFTNTSSVTSTFPTITAGQVTSTTTTTVTPLDDLSVSLSGPTTSTPVGQNVVYQATVSNIGVSDATGVILTDTLPAGVTFVSATASDGSTATEANGIVTDTIGPVAAGDVVVLTITVATSGVTPNSITNTAVVMGNEDDSDPTNNTATITSVIVPSADLAVTSDSISTPPSVVAGTPVTFIIDVANNGPSAATGALITDTLPIGLTFVSGTAAGGAVTVSSTGVVTAPIGALAIGGTSQVTITVMTGASGKFSDLAVVSSDDADPNTTNNTGSAVVAVTALTDLAVTLTGPAGPFNINNNLTYTAVVTNTGPSPASSAVLTNYLFGGANFVSATVDGVSGGTVANGLVTVPLGTIAAGQSVTVVITVLPTEAGTGIDTVQVTAAEPDSNPSNNIAMATTILIVPQPIIEFSASSYTTTEDAGSIAITLNRIGDLSGIISVHFSTFSGNATAGRDYTPVDEVVTFPVGVSTETVTVPILANPTDSVNEYVGLQLDTPTAAILPNGASTSLALLEIVNLDPILFGPTVTGLNLLGPIGSITGVEVDTTGNLNPTTATNTANYAFVAYGSSAKGTLPAGTIVAITSAIYDPTTGAVLLIPSKPLPTNQLFLIDVNGSRTGAITDLAGNNLNSAIGFSNGSDYLYTFARGNNIHYTDENGTPVNVKLSGPGTLDLDRSYTGQVEQLQVLGATKKTSVTGSAGHKTTIGAILGLGRFGSIITKLYSPPFYAGTPAYPNPLNLVNIPATDTLLPSTSTTATTTATTTTKSTVKAKAVVAVATTRVESVVSPTVKIKTKR